MAKRQTNNVGKKSNNKSNNIQTISSGRLSTEQTKVAEVNKTRQSQQYVKLTHEQISERAKSIWLQRGCPKGDDDRNWYEAENQLKQELSLAK